MQRFKVLPIVSWSLCGLFLVAAIECRSRAADVQRTLSCTELSVPYDGIRSTGSVKVPVTVDSRELGKDLGAIKSINRMFKAEQVEKYLFDPAVDLQSKLRLLSEFRCFGTWKRQHDFYRRVLMDSRCLHVRHVAAQMLEFDVCAPETVTVLLVEYERSLQAETRELIIRKLGISRDKKAIAAVDAAVKSDSKALSKAAREGKEYGQTQSCAPQEPGAKPYYGYTDVAEVCESNEVELAPAAPTVTPTPTVPAPAAPSALPSGPVKDSSSGGAEAVDFSKPSGR